MRPTIAIKVPDIGDFKDIPIIEVLVKVGDSVVAEQPLITLETDKATVDVPAPVAGVVQELKVKVGDKVSQGSVILLLEAEEQTPSQALPPAPPPTLSLRYAPPSPRGRGAGEREFLRCRKPYPLSPQSSVLSPQSRATSTPK